MNNIACLYLPLWPIQRLKHEKPELKKSPVLLYEVDSSQGEMVAQVSPVLRSLGIVPGLPLTEAKVLLGRRTAYWERWNRFADEAALRRLACECQHFSPIVGITAEAQPDSLLLDLRGCLHLYGGEGPFCRQLLTFFIERGFAARLAVGPTVGRAWAIAHFGVRKINRYRVAQEDDFLALPVEALRLASDLVARLHEFDLARIGQLLSLPRETLRPRFGADLPRQIDLLFDREAETVVPERLPEPVSVIEELEYPIGEHRLIEIVIQRLLTSLSAQLEKLQHGLVRLAIRFQHADQTRDEILVGTVRPTNDVENVFGLIRLKLERYRLVDKVQTIRLTALETAPLRYRRLTLFEEQSHRERRELESLINRLKTRLGAAAVLQVEPRDDYQPERSVNYYSALSTGVDLSSHSVPSGIRPLTLFPQPVAVPVNSVVPNGPPLRFWWKQQEHITDITWGPERIETGWWRDDPIRRDYYRVETTRQQRFWLFRRRDQQDWFLHGCFD